MKNLLLFLCLLPIVAVAWPRYRTGDTLYVGAGSGLNLRDDVGLAANKLGTVPYGAAVVMLQDPKDGTTFEVEELPGFTISGLWIKVRYQGQEGYVFDGYLTRLPMPPQGSNRQDTYFGDILPKTQEKDVVHRYCLTESDQPCHLTQYFAGPIIRSQYFFNEAAVQGTLWLPAATSAEAYLLMRALYYHPERQGIRAIAEGHQRVLIFLEEESVGCEGSLFLLPGGILIEYLCSC